MSYPMSLIAALILLETEEQIEQSETKTNHELSYFNRTSQNVECAQKLVNEILESQSK